MKAKFLLPTLVGLSLVACTAEDDFSQNAEVKCSPVTFTVEKDGASLGSRAGLEGSVVKFEMGDLISLYHNSTLPGSYPGNILAGQNAIFEGDGLDGTLTFKTKSMVLQGNAVMVYPADTSFVNTTGSDITISVPTEQDGNTKLFQPYMSEAFEIGAYVGNKDAEGNKNTAGYGRNYIVPLKKVGSLLKMNLSAQNLDIINDIEGVDDVVLESVEINAGIGNNIFAESVVVTAKDATPVLAIENAAENSDAEKFAHLNKVTEVTTASSVSLIATEDIENNVACFTLLPQTTTANATTTTVTVYTSYGKVAVVTADAVDANEATTYPLVKAGETSHKTLADAINTIVNSAWDTNESSLNFEGEKTGASFTRTLTFDMQNLDMRGANVKTSKQLIDLLKVYDALGTNPVVTWNLAAEGSNFLMTGAALDKLIEVNANSKITLALNGNQITLSDADATVAKFQNAKVVLDGDANVILAAGVNWTIDQKMTTDKISTLTNKGTLVVTNTTSDAPVNLAVNLTNDGAMSIGSSKVTLGEFTSTATSTMTVASGNTLYFGDDANLYGSVTNEGIIAANVGVVNNFGTIDNKFEVSVVENSGGAFNNGGTIKNNGSLAVTYLTSNNATKNSKVWKGIIELTNRNDQVSIDGSGQKGFIKYTLKDTEANYVPAKGDKFNWLIINKTGNVSLANTSADGTVNETVDYLELNGNPVNIIANGFTTTVLFVEQSMRLLDGNSMNATYIYVKDYILRAAGTLSGNKVSSYTPSTYPGVEEAIPYNGEIRTAK